MKQGLVLDYLRFRPVVGARTGIAEHAAVIGRARVGADSSFAGYATVRADGEAIAVGANAWFGGHATVHIADGILGAAIGDGATVGRYGLVHACKLGDGVVIGESSVVMDAAAVGAHAAIAADSVVPPRKQLPGGFLYAGHPATPVRAIGRDELAAWARALREGRIVPELTSARLPAWSDAVRDLPRPSNSMQHPHSSAADPPRPSSDMQHAHASVASRFAGAFVAPTALVAGAVTLAADSGVFFGSAVNAGDGRIVIGPRTNIQDNCIVTTDRRRGDLVLGAGVTVGHAVVLGSGSIGDDALIGMGSRVGDGVVVERGGCIGAGAWVEAGTVVPAGWIWAGRPACEFRRLKPAERDEFARARDIYIGYSRDYRRGGRAT